MVSKVFKKFINNRIADNIKKCDLFSDFQYGFSSSQSTAYLLTVVSFKKKTLWPLFMDGVQLPQGYSHFEEAVYFLPFSSQKFLELILSTSEG